jgi:hypothetical protein
MAIPELVKKLFDNPVMDEGEIEAIVWGCTGYPSFFIGDPIRCFVRQLRHAKRSLARGFTIDQIFEGKDRIAA